MMAKRLPATLVAFALSAAHFASFDIFSRPIITDIRFFLYYAWRVSEGAVPHLDFFENKPQLSTFAGAFFFKLGDFTGIDPLLAIRFGSLAIATAGGVLSFWIFRRLGRGSSTVGFLGLLSYCSFGLLGVVPAVGIVPKLLMAVLASAAALLVHDRRWFLAGVTGALAFMDWQIGALVWVSAFATAALFENPRRPAVMAVIAGGAVGIAPFLLYYAVNGALGETFEQVIVATFSRGSAALHSQGLGERIAKITGLLETACPEQQWLFFASFLGGLFILRWLFWDRDRERNLLLMPLCIFHGGLLGFNLLDFQHYGDLFVMLHSIAFLLGLSWVALFETGTAVLGTRFPGNSGALRAFGALILVVAVAAGRPAFLRPDIEIPSSTIQAGGTLADQREVAAELLRQTRGRKLVLMDSSELLFLMRHRNPLSNIYMNRATQAHFSASGRESIARVASRLLSSVDPDVFIESRMVQRVTPFVAGYAKKQISSMNGKYRISLRVRD
jgi:hypothetical protein